MHSHGGIDGGHIQCRTHTIGKQIKLLLTVLLHGDKLGPGRIDALPFAQKFGQFFGQFAGVEQAVQVGTEYTVLHTALRRAVCKDAERTAPHLGAACVDLVARQLYACKGFCGHTGCGLGQVLFGAEHRRGGQQAKAPQGAGGAALLPCRVAELFTQHLVAAAHAQHRRTGC